MHAELKIYSHREGFEKSHHIPCETALLSYLNTQAHPTTYRVRLTAVLSYLNTQAHPRLHSCDTNCSSSICLNENVDSVWRQPLLVYSHVVYYSNVWRPLLVYSHVVYYSNIQTTIWYQCKLFNRRKGHSWPVVLKYGQKIKLLFIITFLSRIRITRKCNYNLLINRI